MEKIKLPEDWLKHATPVSDHDAASYKRWRPEGGIMIDDNCPLQTSVVIIKKEAKEPQVVRITDPKIVSSFLEESKYQEEIKRLCGL